MRADHVWRLGLRPAAAFEAVKGTVGAVSARVTGAVSRTTRGPERWVERRLPLDIGVSGAARRVVGEALGGRVALPVVDRAQLIVSELVSHGMLHTAGSSGEVTIRLGLLRTACRIEVETDAPARAMVSHPYVQTYSERCGFERTASGATRIWAELSDVTASSRLDDDAAARTGPGAAASAPADVHVVPNARAATWQVYDARMAQAMSEHSTETEAEAAARMCAQVRGGRRIVIHDRYHRTRDTTCERVE